MVLLDRWVNIYSDRPWNIVVSDFMTGGFFFALMHYGDMYVPVVHILYQVSWCIQEKVAKNVSCSSWCPQSQSCWWLPWNSSHRSCPTDRWTFANTILVISRKFLIKYYGYSLDFLIINMDQLRLTHLLSIQYGLFLTGHRLTETC